MFVGSCNGTSGGFEALRSFQLCFSYDLIGVEMGNITKTCLYYFDPLKAHFYIVKLGFTGVYIFFIISAHEHRLWVTR